MGRWQDDIARSFESLSYRPLKAFLVFYKKDGRSYIFSVFDGSFVSRDCFNWFIDSRQIDLKGRATIHFCVEPDMSVNLFHDGIDGGQAQPCTATCGFRCEEWFKHARADFGADAHSRIADSEDNIRSWNDVEMTACIKGINVNVRSLNCQSAAVRHCVSSVDNQVHND